MDPGSKTMAAQDFRHSAQLESESVADFIRRLEEAYQIAYGRDRDETHSAVWAATGGAENTSWCVALPCWVHRHIRNCVLLQKVRNVG